MPRKSSQTVWPIAPGIRKAVVQVELHSRDDDCWLPLGCIAPLQCGTTPFALAHPTISQRDGILVLIVAADAVQKCDWVMKFLALAKDDFSPSQTCFLHIPAHFMCISFRAILEPIGIRYSTVWSVGVSAFIKGCVVWCLHSFVFGDKGGDSATPSESLWTLQLQLSRGGFFNRRRQQQFSSTP